MRAPADWTKKQIAPALFLLLGLHAVLVHGGPRSGSNGTAVTVTDVCESRTINYITHTLPQQCLRTSWASPTTAAASETTASSTTTTTVTATTTATSSESVVNGSTGRTTQDNGTSKEQDGQEELAASSFMSFEEWKEMMLRKSGHDPAHVKAHKQRESHHRGGRDPSLDNGGDSFGEEGEISLDFDALAEKVSEITSPKSGSVAPDSKKGEVREEQVLYDDGKTQYYRSKDAGKTCKERFSYSSFDAGATVLKTSPGAKNAKAILVENKDSYMLLECRQKNKFVIVELSDDILVDTIVIANFEFFSSMIRHFRVSASDRYPVKDNKWVELGTFEARNSRDIQAFLVEHPHIFAKYIRIEFLTHYGNEFYCPVSLLRVHGTRMLDTWKEPSHDNEPEQVEGSPQEPAAPVSDVQQDNSSVSDNSSSTVLIQVQDNFTEAVTETSLTPWLPVFYSDLSLEACPLRSPTAVQATPVQPSANGHLHEPVAGNEKATIWSSSSANSDEPANGASAPMIHLSSESAMAQEKPSNPSPVGPNAQPNGAGTNSTARSFNGKSSDVHADASEASSSATTTTNRNKTTSISTSPSASPTVQESFFKTVNKRLQLLESNTSLSLQYIEQQSRFLQDVLLKMERKHITRIDAFLDSLNKTVLTELRNVRTQYDQIWQSTVLALETQREQSQREIVALTSRLNVLADEVVFQKRMAILQSVLLLACLVLVIFSRGGLSVLDGGPSSLASLPGSFGTAAGGSSAFSPYRRYGYGRPLSPTPSASSPFTVGAASDNNGTSSGSGGLAASAMPRYRSTVLATNRDKSLPLTPTVSEYGSREGTPTVHKLTTNNGDSGEESPTRPSTEQGDDIEDIGMPSTPPSERRKEGEGGGEREREGTKGEEEKPPPDRARSSVAQLAGLNMKPLPALPEDPS